MKFITKCSLILSCFLGSTSIAQAKDNHDLHFGASAAFGYATESFLHYKTDLSQNKRIAYATAIGTLPGLIKELHDDTETNNSFDEGDLLADIAGALVGSLIANSINKKMHVNLSKKKGAPHVSVGYSF